MSNDNETVEQVCEKMKEPSIYKGRFPASFFDGEFREFADRIIAAHEREMNALAAKKTSEAHEAFVKNAELADAIAAKDKEIAQLVSVINSECKKCGDCAKFGSDCNAGDIDGNENCRACKKFVSKEVSALRALVKEMLSHIEELYQCQSPCYSRCLRKKESCEFRARRKLIFKAREVVK